MVSRSSAVHITSGTGRFWFFEGHREAECHRSLLGPRRGLVRTTSSQCLACAESFGAITLDHRRAHDTRHHSKARRANSGAQRGPRARHRCPIWVLFLSPAHRSRHVCSITREHHQLTWKTAPATSFHRSLQSTPERIKDDRTQCRSQTRTLSPSLVVSYQRPFKANGRKPLLQCA